jgi:hypothetical protein
MISMEPCLAEIPSPDSEYVHPQTSGNNQDQEIVLRSLSKNKIPGKVKKY